MPASSSGRAPLVAQSLVSALGVAFLVGAWRADVEWFERRWSLDAHHVFVAWLWRGAWVACGLALALWARPRVGAWVARVGWGEALAACARQAVAVVLALAASEMGLRVLHLPRRPVALEQRIGTARGEPHPRYGWVFKASQSVEVEMGGRKVAYAFDADHDRAPTPSSVVDPKLPTLLFVGESVTAGHALEWSEAYPTLVGDALGMQVAVLAVDGYGTDQAFLRLVDELPRFEHPVAIVSFFIPSMVDRLSNDDHPWLVFEGGRPAVVPADDPWRALRLVRAFHELAPYRSEGAIQLADTVFVETARLAAARGARAVFVTPCLGAGWPRGDGYLIDTLLRAHGFTVVDPDFHFEGIPGDNHPTPAATRRLADAVTQALRTELGLARAP